MDLSGPPVLELSGPVRRTLSDTPKEIKEQVILKSCTTRWLNLGKVLERILDQWDALVEYFSRKLDDKICQDIYDLLDSESYVYIRFLVEVIGFFEDFNRIFQS